MNNIRIRRIRANSWILTIMSTLVLVLVFMIASLAPIRATAENASSSVEISRLLEENYRIEMEYINIINKMRQEIEENEGISNQVVIHRNLFIEI